MRARERIELFQDETHPKPSPPSAAAPIAEPASKPAEDPWQEFCHQINGPLTSILINCDLLLKGACPPGDRERVETILDEALRISQRLRTFRPV